MTATAKVRIPRRVLTHIEGMSLWSTRDPDKHGYDEGGERLVAAITAATARRDGSVYVEVDYAAGFVLYEIADDLALSAADDAGFPPYGDASALADVRSAKALLRTLDEVLWPLRQVHR